MGHVARMVKIIVGGLMGELEGKRRFVRPNFRWQNKKWTLSVMLGKRK